MSKLRLLVLMGLVNLVVPIEGMAVERLPVELARPNSLQVSAELKSSPPARTTLPAWTGWTAIVLLPLGIGIGWFCGTRQKRDDANHPASDHLASNHPDPDHPDPDHPDPDNEDSVQPQAHAIEHLNSERSNSLSASTHHSAHASVGDATEISPTTRLAKVDIVETLITDLRQTDPNRRHKAIWELGQRGDSRAVQPLTNLLVDSDSNQRSLILAAISEISIRTLKPMHRALLVSLQDDSSEVRKNAIRDVTRIYDLIAQVSQVLHHATSDSDEEVRQTAQWAMLQLNRIRAADPEATSYALNGSEGNAGTTALPPNSNES